MKMAGIQISSEIKNEHPLFCPVYTLDQRLQSGIGMIPKWDPRSTAGVYLGHLPVHASNVALVLNISTGCISPQYHVVFDDAFSTIDFITNRQQPSNWEELCRYHTEDYNMIPPIAAKINNLRTKIRWLDDLEDMVTPDISDPSRPTEITPLRRTDEDEHHNFSV